MCRYHGCNKNCFVKNVLIKLFNMFTITTKDKSLGEAGAVPRQQAKS